MLQHVPPHTCYAESFGAAGVLMQKPRSYTEVYNGLDGDIVNLFRVLQSQDSRSGLVVRLGFGSSGRGTVSRTECIWLNPACVNRVSHIGLDLGESDQSPVRA